MASSPRSPPTTLASPSSERSVTSVRTVVGASPAVTLASSPGETVPTGGGRVHGPDSRNTILGERGPQPPEGEQGVPGDLWLESLGGIATPVAGPTWTGATTTCCSRALGYLN